MLRITFMISDFMLPKNLVPKTVKFHNWYSITGYHECSLHSEQKLPNVGYLPNAQFATVFEDTHANWVELPKFFWYLRYPDLSRTKYPGFLGILKYPYLLHISDTHKFLEVEDTHVLCISRYPIFATLYIIKHWFSDCLFML